MENRSHDGEDDDKDQKTFTDVMNVEGPWQTQVDKRKARRVNKALTVTIHDVQNENGQSRKVEQHRTNGSSLLCGVTREESILLYVRNLSVEDRTEEEMCRDVKKFGKMVGIQIMTTEIIKNRYCQDVVGCKIRIPSYQVEKAQSVETWPDDVICRKWEAKSYRGQRQGYYKG